MSTTSEQLSVTVTESGETPQRAVSVSRATSPADEGEGECEASQADDSKEEKKTVSADEDDEGPTASRVVLDREVTVVR